MRHLFGIIMLLSTGSLAGDLDWLDLDGRHLKCAEGEDFYDFYFRGAGVDAWAHDWRNGHQNQYFMKVDMSSSKLSNRCQIGAVIRLHDEAANREFVFEHVLSDMCAFPRKPMSYLIDSDGKMTHLKCALR